MENHSGAFSLEQDTLSKRTTQYVINGCSLQHAIVLTLTDYLEVHIFQDSILHSIPQYMGLKYILQCTILQFDYSSLHINWLGVLNVP